VKTKPGKFVIFSFLILVVKAIKMITV